MKEYNPKKIEEKWQKKWSKENLFSAQDESKKEKYYFLVEFPYPSGEGLHVGHLRSYTAMDVLAHKKRMDGFNVLYPIGWDAFGLPAENYALKHGVHPEDSTKKNVANFKRQCQMMGFSFDWDREISTIDPKYYKWTQWIFLQLYEKGLAYQSEMAINWCPSCKTGLANEEVIQGKCERCGQEVEKKKMNQWMLKITEYADKLIKDLEEVDYLEQIKTQQINWIGKSEGSEIDFRVSGTDYLISVFTTRPDTLYGATYMVLAPEHELVERITTNEQKKEVQEYIAKAKNKSDLERTELQKDKTGVFTGATAVNPANGELIPVWVADYVLTSYGTGAIMSVPAHDDRDKEFAEKYKLPIVGVVDEKGKMINSAEFDGMDNERAKRKITKKVQGREKTNYKLRDWVFSRQHYWGEPIPIIHCEKCGEVPVPERDLPVELPKIKKYEPSGTGESPLAAVEDWVNVTCPECGGKAKRETDTMPNWAGSSWYFLRYIDPKNDKDLADKKKLKYWMSVDWYNGGMEHTTLHLLYSRFWYKFLYEIGVAPTKEPYKKRTSHGMILATDGTKMSKSKGNVVNPDSIVEKYGADVLRVYEMFIGPFDQAAYWNPKSIDGVKRFLDRVWGLQDRLGEEAECDQDCTALLHQTIKKVSTDIEGMHFNTAISQMMILVNEMMRHDKIPQKAYEALLILICPFAPHMAEELWEGLGYKESIFTQEWIKHSEELIKTEEIELVVQVNGKVRDKIMVSPDLSEEEAKEKALTSKKVAKFTEGKEPKKIIFVPGKLVNIVV